MDSYSVDPAVGGPGWGIQRVGPCVLGYWTKPMSEERLHECRRLYRIAHRAHGLFAVFSVFTDTPFSLETMFEARARTTAVDLLNEYAEHLLSLTCVFEMPSGFRASIARTSAAAVTRLTHRSVPFVFADSRKDAFRRARERGALDLVDEPTHERHLAELKRLAESPA